MAPKHKFTMTCLILGKLCDFLLLHAQRVIWHRSGGTCKKTR